MLGIPAGLVAQRVGIAPRSARGGPARAGTPHQEPTRFGSPSCPTEMSHGTGTNRLTPVAGRPGRARAPLRSPPGQALDHAAGAAPSPGALRRRGGLEPDLSARPAE